MERGKLFVVEKDDGTVGLVRADTVVQARAQAIEDEGRRHVRKVKKATPNDIAWIQQMGGVIPEEENEEDDE